MITRAESGIRFDLNMLSAKHDTDLEHMDFEHRHYIDDVSWEITKYINNTSDAIVHAMHDLNKNILNQVITEDKLNEYVDKRDNLIRLDFADADAILRRRIENVSSLLNDTTETIETLIGPNVTSTIDTFKEIEEFLKTIDNKETLVEMLKSMQDDYSDIVDDKLDNYDADIKQYILNSSTAILKELSDTSNAITKEFNDKITLLSEQVDNKEAALNKKIDDVSSRIKQTEFDSIMHYIDTIELNVLQRMERILFLLQKLDF